jgi:CO/xanthine dehydrogenase Mo-binding subunit
MPPCDGTIIDELAEKCAIDPIDFRLLNAVTEGSAQTAGPPFKRIGFVETLNAIKSSPHYRSKIQGANRGRGVAAGFWFNAGLQSSAVVNIHNDGTASVVAGSADVGGSRASMAMIAAEVLELDLSRVRSLVSETDSIGYRMPLPAAARLWRPAKWFSRRRRTRCVNSRSARPSCGRKSRKRWNSATVYSVRPVKESRH